jgi:nicotinamidase-related amidase
MDTQFQEDTAGTAPQIILGGPSVVPGSLARGRTTLSGNEAILVVIDVQQKLLPAISRGEEIVKRCEILVQGAKALGVPVVLTEQYPSGLGSTTADITRHAGDCPCVEKMTFSCAREPAFMSTLEISERRQVLLCGIETHVCVLQTALGLLEDGYVVHVAADAVGSRSDKNHENALSRLGKAGAIITNTESALFEMLEKAGTDEFKTIARLIR